MPVNLNLHTFYNAAIERILGNNLKGYIVTRNGQNAKDTAIKEIAGAIRNHLKQKGYALVCETHDRIVKDLENEIRILKSRESNEKRWRKLLIENNIPLGDTNE